MKSFTDGTNSWSIDINVGSIKRVLASTGINLSQPHESDEDGQTLADRLIRDTILQVDVIYALLEPQVVTNIKLTDEETTTNDSGEPRKMNPEEIKAVRIQKFCELMKPEYMKHAEAALLEEWSDFFLKLGRETTAKAINQTRQVQDTMRDEGSKQLERLQGAQVTVMTKALSEQVDEVLRLANDAVNGVKTSENATESLEESASMTSTT